MPWSLHSPASAAARASRQLTATTRSSSSATKVPHRRLLKGRLSIRTRSPAQPNHRAYLPSSRSPRNNTAQMPPTTETTERLAEGMQKMGLRGCMTKQSSVQRLETLRDSMRKSIQFVRPLNDGVKKEFRRDSILAAPMRIFYDSEKSRDEAFEMMMDVSEMMAYLAGDAKMIMTSADATPEQQEEVMEYLLWDGIDLSVTKIQGVKCYGIEVCEGIFWEAYVMTQDSGSELFDADRNSPGKRGSGASKRGSDVSTESDVQFENFKMIRKVQSDTRKKVVVWQMDSKAPMRPETLVIAEEKDGVVTPCEGEKFYKEREEEKEEIE